MNNQPEKKNYLKTLNIRYYDLANNCKISFPSICLYLQEAATEHADQLKIASWNLTEQHLTWVLYRIKVRMTDYPGYNRKIIIDTWPAIVKDPYAIRAFRLFDENNNQIGAALNYWLLFDLETRKPVRIPDFIYAFHDESLALPMEAEFKRIPKLGSLSNHKEFEVLYRDIDTNQHTNNVSYIHWVLNTLPYDQYQQSLVEAFDIEFKNETFIGQKIIGINQLENPVDPNTYHVYLNIKDENRAAAAARVTLK